MGAGFIRRFSANPGTDVITQIEGVTIIDQAPTAPITGVGTGVVCIVGEFQDMTYATKVNSDGTISTNPKPVQVFSSADLLTKGGGFDEFLGDFGGDMGNGFVEARNKQYAGLIIAPVDFILATVGAAQGSIRLWRQLPTNQSATAAQPIVPVSAAVVPAGTEFKNAGNRARTAQAVTFTDNVAFVTGTDGDVETAGPAATGTFLSAGSDFVTAGVQEGDILVLGVISGAGALGANADTYRVVSVTDLHTLVIQKLDGSSFSTTDSDTLPFRIHFRTTADSAVDAHQLSEGAGYGVRARPLDATLGTAVALTPSTVPPAGSATSWNPLSGLIGAVHPATALTYNAAIHAPNVASSASVEARYEAAVDALLSDDDPARLINILVPARTDAVIRAYMKGHVDTASARGLTRTATINPAVSQATLNTVIGSSDPGVGTNRDERIDYSWPALQTFVPEAVDFAIKGSDGKTYTDGLVDIPAAGVLAQLMSNLAPERNPGQAAPPVPALMAMITGFARGMPTLGQPEYITLRAYGVAAPRKDRVTGFIFQSGITTSLTNGEKNIARRRMADYIQDSLAQALNAYCKLPLTIANQDNAVADVNGFLNGLKSPNDPSAQRIDDYSIDDVSGNTPATRAQGIFVIIVTVKLTPTGDFIVLNTQISEGAVITQVVSQSG